jgi:hypothetical protein
MLPERLPVMDELQRYPLSCEKREDGLLFHFSDGTSKFIPNWTPPMREPEAGKRGFERCRDRGLGSEVQETPYIDQ